MLALVPAAPLHPVSIELIADAHFNADVNVDRGVIVYGNRDVNGAWATLLADAPIQVNRVAVLAGQRLTATLPMFLAGVGWPDWMVLRADALQSGEEAIEGAGFFGWDWSLDPQQSRWRD
jgi:hypothetical protein